MLRQFWNATAVLFVLTLVTGVIYPLAVTGVALVVFPSQAHGSLLSDSDGLGGSSLIGQSFDAPEYFWGRLSATGPFPYNAGSSSGSNFGPLHPGLKEAALARVAALKKFDPKLQEPIPVDLITASGSGLDPEISPAAAEIQIQRVAQARSLPLATVQALVQRHTQGRQWGLLGEPRVNVLLLNRDLKNQANLATDKATEK